MEGQTNSGSKVVNEFLCEAQEVVEALSHVLMEIDRLLRTAEEIDPDCINEAFRHWHSLKGLSATFGVEPLSQLAHHEETKLDDIRLGRIPLTETVLDGLLESVEQIMSALKTIGEAGTFSALTLSHTPSVDNLEQSTTAAPNASLNHLQQLIPSAILEVLTEFEEHRLLTSIEKSRPLYRIRISFSLTAIDTELDTIKKMLKPLGEIITYLPCEESDSPAHLDIEVVLALKSNLTELETTLSGYPAQIEMLLNPEDIPNIQPAVTSPEDTAASTTASSRPFTNIEPSPTRTSKIAPPDAPITSLQAVSQTVRVDISKLDHLMNAVGELGLVRSAINRLREELGSIPGRGDLAIELHRIVRGFERRLSDIREGILEVRMVPVGQMFERLSRVIRKVSRNLNKEIQFIVSGTDTEVDKLIIEKLSDPMMHIIRNAIDHGIEPVQERRHMGKPDMGTLALTAYQKGNHVVIEVEDDGKGIDDEQIRDAAVRTGQISTDQAALLSPREALNLIFLPGVSTTSEPTEISGRGVGMDVVKTNIASMGGLVEVESELGIGTKFTITMPVTLAITPALLISIHEGVFAIPLSSVAEAMPLCSTDVRRVMNTDTLSLRGQTLPLCRLDTWFNLRPEGPSPDGSRVVVASLGHRRLGLVVDTLVGQQDVIIKPLGPALSTSGCFSGVTDIGSQRLALVLDTVAVIEEFFATADEGSAYIA